jgi:hypothetical protein
VNNFVVVVLSILLIIGLLCWLFIPNAKDFGLNFFTEMLGATITIFVLDRLIKHREEKKNIPQKLAAYEDVRLYTSRYISFWIDAYRESVPEEEPETIDIFFSENGMSKIWNYLYMDSEPNVTPSRKWWTWIIQNVQEFKSQGDKILDRYSYNLDPVVFGFLHQLTESSLNYCILLAPNIRQSDSEMGFSRIAVLGNYSIPPQEEDFKAIIGLYKWCNEQYIILKKHDASIKKVAEYSRQLNRPMPPKCMISPVVLQQQSKKL